jgi:PAS domain S-box-containing protein
MSQDWTEEKFRALTMHSADIISLLDGEGRLLFNSPATVRINGFTPEELQDRDTFELIHPEDRDAVARAFGSAVATPGAVITVEYRYLTKDGRWLWMEAVACNQLDNPAVRGVVAISRDVSERRRAEEERLRLEQQLLQVQKLEGLGLLAGGVAHDFNNLLAIILGETSLLRLTASGPVGESLANIEQAARQAAELTQRLLTYAGGRRAEKAPVDLAHLVTDLEPLLRLSARGVAGLEVTLPPELPNVVADAGQVRQVLLNLVQNAAEATPESGAVRVRLAPRELDAATLARCQVRGGVGPGHVVAIEVTDQGPGIGAETLARIFDPFFTTKQAGRGLGLAAVSGVVRGHEAALLVETAAGRGSTFTAFFASTAAPARAEASGSSARFAGRVLLVDDEPAVGRTTARVLTALGFEVEVSTSGREAVARLAARPQGWTLSVCDLVMPEMDGHETTRRLRALAPELPVLQVSGHPPAADAPAAPSVAFLAKPYSTADLVEAVRRLVPQAERAAAS